MTPFHQYIKAKIVAFILFISFCLLATEPPPVIEPSRSEIDLYSTQIQPILNNRCVACHSCLESPCQLNLQSYEGLLRGLTKERVYNPSRLSSIKPTRLHIDALTSEEWASKGFLPVLPDSSKSFAYSALGQALQSSFSFHRVFSPLPVQQSLSCVSTSEYLENKKTPFSMPYNLASISINDYSKIANWVNQGQKPPKKSSRRDFFKDDIGAIVRFEEMLNYDEPKNRLVARYLYEHLFLADIFFSSKDSIQPNFYKLIRSSEPCSEYKIIATSVPNEDPKVAFPYYCILKNVNSVAAKNHLPYKINNLKLDWFNEIFINSKWDQKIVVPNYDNQYRANPFLTFQSIPIESRYRFLLEDSWYHIMTFIKGPVCNGNSALDSIQNQFYVFFTDPKMDLAVINPQFRSLLNQVDNLPGELGSDVSTSLLSTYLNMHTKRKANRDYKNTLAEITFPNGRGLESVWDGNGTNPNAVVTVLRHNDYSSVLQGAVGTVSKTIFLLDYSTFERLVYNLVVNFDVFGNFGHQILTRMYMDIIRMDSENNFLELMPKKLRKEIKASWYRSNLGITDIKMRAINEYKFSDTESTIKVISKKDLVSEILYKRFNDVVRGKIDPLYFNKFTDDIGPVSKTENETTSDIILSELTNNKVGENTFARYFPEVAYLVVTKNGKPISNYNIIANKEFRNISWIFFEQQRRLKEQDSLIISHNFLAAGPNIIFTIEASDIREFVDRALKIDSESAMYQFKLKYQINRLNPSFWDVYDYLNNAFLAEDPVRAGFIDLTRYEWIN